MSDLDVGRDWTVACVIATEVPPEPQGDFTADQIIVAIHAVCDVIRNRVADLRFPKSPVGVVLQRGQLPPTLNDITLVGVLFAGGITNSKLNGTPGQ